MAKRVLIKISYDGTNYCGWQIQINGITVEEVINRELSALLGEKIEVIGASRTDSGVHALGNIAVFDTETKIPAEKISFALNQRLPEDIRIEDSYEVPCYFHPRYASSTKTYEYKILNRKFPIPTKRLYSHFVYMPLDIDKMKKAAEYIVGEHDFKSFCSTWTQVNSTVRAVYSLDIEKNGDMIAIRISGNGFLYNMVRIIVGTLIKVGLSVYPPEHVKEIIDAKDRNAAGPKAPANGLTLVSIDYETDAITKGIDSIIFDIDGTIWDIRNVVAEGWSAGIRENTDMKFNFTPEYLGTLFGKTMDEIFEIMYPEISGEEKEKLVKIFYEYEHKYIKLRKPQPYENVEDTLKYLTEKYPLYLVTYAGKGYIEEMFEATGLQKYFKGWMCHGDTMKSKDVTIRTLMEKYNLKSSVYVGDTQGDASACEKAEVPFIYAEYGLGNVEKPEYIIRDISDLKKYF